MNELVFTEQISSVVFKILHSFLIPQATEVFQHFLQSQVSIEKSILQADRALTQGEKDTAGMGLGAILSGVGRFLQCSLTDHVKVFPKQQISSSSVECPFCQI